jgi:hypothetical protein
MAKFVLTAEKVLINAVDMTQWCSSAELSFTTEEKDVTNYQSAGWHEMLGGLKQGTLKLNFYNDYSASAVDQLLWPLFGTVTSFEVAATQGSRSTTNPSYTGNVLVSQYNPLAGKVGDVDSVSVTWKTTAAITRATS